MRPIFDGHGDLALYAVSYNRDQTEPVAVTNEREEGMTDAFGRGCSANSLPEMRLGGVGICQSSLAVRVAAEARPTLRTDLNFATHRMAYAHAHAQLAYYRVLEQQDEVRLIRTAEEMNIQWQTWESASEEERLELPVGIIVAMECADPIVEPSQAELWWEDGLRSVMLSHFGHSQYAAGTGVTGPLTAKGVELLAEFERLGMILDLSHTSEESF